ncbi:hypothetical protein RF11_02546 [Thelohanellus kitauei]|uniref:Uncharacterized protein n=1 Tax=Thelohanellus kitauei TaxID=669202 RepID=A0A0C2IFP5_THEKT|nr:hypothetical protein RF11_02546 [Thelohanellus kitauei]
MVDRSARLQMEERMQSNSDMVKILIDIVIMAIKLNASMLSVQEIHQHVAKYVEISESWRSKNYAFMMSEWRKSSFHTLIFDESTDISFQKLLILYFKYRPETENIYKTIFGGIVKLTS